MSDQVTAEVSGLQISNNTFSASPPGSLLLAENAVMPQKGVIEPRRGQDRYATPPTSNEITFAQTEFQGDSILSSAPDKLTQYTLGVAANPTTDFTGGPWNPVDFDGSSSSYARMKFGFGGGYLYFCTTTGPKALESTADTPRAAGLLRMPDGFAYMNSNTAFSGTSNWLAYGSTVAYRSLLRKPTSDGVSLLSPPSGRIIITNRIRAAVGQMSRTVPSGTTVTVALADTGGFPYGLSVGDSFTLSPGESNFPAGTYTIASTPSLTSFTYVDAHAAVAATNTVQQDFNVGSRSTTVVLALPSDATTETPVRLYRSRASTSTTTEPSDEVFLVDERFPTAPEIASGEIFFEDVTPESVISDPLYTNPQTGEGALQTNDQPPIYRDLAYWADRMWYSNWTGQQTFRLQMLGVGSPDGIQDGDTLTITVDTVDYIFTFKNSPSGTGEVQIISNGTPSYNIQRTAQFLVLNVIGVFEGAGVPIRAYYSSGQNEAPGKILIQSTSYSQSAFSVVASRPETWVPALDSTTAVDSTAERVPNGLAYSKLGESEAVPLINRTTAGSKNYPIARIVALRQALLIFKEGDGIYSLTGGYPFTVTQISTANIIAPDACCVFVDNAWVYTDQGILRISDSGGATVVSRPIETELAELRALLPSETYDYSFAVPYETERRVLFFVPFETNASTGLPTLKAWTYNNATQAWTGPLYADAFSGNVPASTDRLCLGVWDNVNAVARVTRERKTQTYLDYADESFTGGITAVNVGGDPLVITLSSTTNLESGDGIEQGSARAVVRSVDGNNVTLYDTAAFTASATCTILKHYDVTIQFQPTGTPTARKTLTRLTWLAKPEWFASRAGNTLVMTDQIQAEKEISTPFNGFGMHTFGTGPFGDPSPLAIDVNPIDKKWASAAQFFIGYGTSEVWSKLRLQGFGAELATATAPVGRGK